jgi:Polysaccharide deacetylase
MRCPPPGPRHCRDDDGARVTRPAATISVDVDPVDLHLLGYGVRAPAPDPLAYSTALPRLIAHFARAGVRATFFVVARDAVSQRAAIAAITTSGHEVASHSLTHPLAFSRLPRERMREELSESRHRLEAVTGEPVLGFRAPNFDLDAVGERELFAAGYRYDASSYPTPLLLPARVVLALKSGDPAGVLRMALWPRSFRRGPHRVNVDLGTLVEFPTSVTPIARMPVYHTMRYFTDRRRFEATLDGFVRRNEPLSYPLHAVDALGLEEDRVDARLARHPGMRVPLAEKLRLLDEVLAAIRARFEVAPFRDRLEGLPGT